MKYVIEFFLLIVYICTMGAITLSFTYHDGSEFCLSGWLI
jgi:hypothetical protein